MGHVTVLASSMAEAEGRIDPLVKLVDRIRGERTNPNVALTTDLQPSVQKSSSDRARKEKSPLVAITMGSDSDRFVLAPGIQLLKELEISHSVTITSAHRTPARMIEFARNAAANGVKVIIAAAGGAAHLPGMIAAISLLPVIGVPVKASVLDGMDSLLSIVQMPRGCPVATVAINNSVNAAQLAVRILAINDVNMQGRLDKYLTDQTDGVLEKAYRMDRVGFEAYGSEELK